MSYINSCEKYNKNFLYKNLNSNYYPQKNS